MNIRIIRLISGLLLCGLLLGGCRQSSPVSQPQESGGETTRNTEPLVSFSETTQPEEEANGATMPTAPTIPTRPSVDADPVTMLTSIKWRTYPQFLSLGGGNILACRNYFEEGSGIVNFLDIFNVYEDAVLVQGRNESPRELVEQRFADDRFVLRDPATNTFYVYDYQLKITDQFTADSVDGYFSKDRASYYYVRDGVLYRMDTATGSYGRVSLEYDLRLESLIGVHPDRDILVARFYLSFYHQNTGICAIDAQTGRFLILTDSVSYLWFDDDTFYAGVQNDKTYGIDISYGSLKGGPLKKVATGFMGGDTASYTMLSDSGLMIWRSLDEKNLSTTVYDLSREGISSKLEQYDFLTAALSPIYLEEEQLIFCLYADQYDFSPALIDPNLLRYEKVLSLQADSWPALVDRSIVLNYEAEVAGPQLPDTLTALRQQADALEATYGVKVLLGGQTLGFCGTDAAVNEDPGQLAKGLSALEATLVLYPRDFFEQFQNSIGEGGVYFCLTGTLDGPLEPTGKARRNGNRYEILLDVESESLESTVHHELWHVTEMKLSTDTFAHPRWTAANPEGFTYYGRYDSGYRELTDWTMAKGADTCSFVDAYARINSREDRARLFEYVMSTDPSACSLSPALKEKLTMMCDAIEQHFQTQDWGTPRWKQVL